MEDHTLGNALRYVLMRNPTWASAATRFRTLQSSRYTCICRPAKALRSGLTDLRKVSTQITDAYRKELKAFKRKNRTN
ncbi:hypothetical protein PRIC2_011599 [Phytophthora ramorum]